MERKIQLGEPQREIARLISNESCEPKCLKNIVYHMICFLVIFIHFYQIKVYCIFTYQCIYIHINN